MKNLVLAGGVLMLLACGKDDKEGNLSLVFRGTYGADALVMFESHPYAFGQGIQFTHSDLLISDVRLIADDGGGRALSDVEMVDLSFSSAADAADGVEITFDKIPEGTYSALRFGIGLDPALNATVPEDYASSHPLSNPGRYWVPWSSFIFARVEGNLDTLVDGIDNPDLGFLYHTGTDDLYLEVETPVEITITDGDTRRLIFMLDHEALLGIPNDPIDIKAKPRNHNPADTLQIQALVDNYSDALSFFIE